MSQLPVTVRMYRGILGDCFLIMIGPEDERSCVLIDCGVLQGVAGGKTRMTRIVENIRDTTRTPEAPDGKLDCLIVTHEHFDHIGGFSYARDLFARMAIGKLWMAWTEDPEDPKGKTLRERFDAAHQKMAALQLGIARAAGGAEENKPGDPDAHRVMGLAGFVAPSDGDLGALAAGKAPRGSKAIYANLRSWVGGEANIDYLSPGHVLDTPGRHALKAYVLAPPSDAEFLFKALPSSGEAKETYLAAEADEALAEASSPFAKRYRWLGRGAMDELAGRTRDELSPQEAYLVDNYVKPFAPCRHAAGEAPPFHDCELDLTCLRYQRYRAIDDALALQQSSLAIKMDANTNNSSLVIAFELPDETTMVFAADAQVGNWLSWEKVRFADKLTREKVEVTTAQLLARARLYKVGHHGSHNATLKARGLELMTHPDLVAMIPTMEDVALDQGSKGWKMPNPETWKGLIKQTRGRILRGDFPQSAGPLGAEAVGEKIDELVVAEGKMAEMKGRESEFAGFERLSFAEGSIEETELYVDYHIVRASD